MANLIRSAKSANAWTTYDLKAFNITVEPVDAATFFGQAALPPPPASVSDAILNNLGTPAADITNAEFQFLTHMGLAERRGLESYVADFARHLLTLVEYDNIPFLICPRRKMGFIMCGKDVHARPNVSLIDISHMDDCILVVHVDQRPKSKKEPEPQLIGEAIAAFHASQSSARDAGIAVPQAKTLPGIIMLRATPLLFKIPVTNELLSSVATGQFPQTPTVAQYLVPPVPKPEVDEHCDDVKLLENRQIMFQCLEAFKQFL